MYLYDENCITPNFSDQGGVSVYYSPNILKAEANLVLEFAKQNDISD